MNKKTTYELTIADKLQQLPLPGMEDAIWTRVKKQLDLDLPEDDGGAGGPAAPSGGWMWSAGLLAFVAALVAVFVLTQKEQNSTTLPVNGTQNTPSIRTPIRQQKSEAPGTPTNRVVVASPQPSNNTTTLNSGEGAMDSASQSPVPLVVKPVPDSAQPLVAVVPPPPVQDSVAKPKPKSRGVPNMTDADYRIVPKKRDST